MMHAYHEGLEGFHPDQIFKDGCPECERRGADIEIALAYMDVPTFRRAWDRGLLLQRGKAEHVSHAEVKVLRVLGQVRLWLLNDEIIEQLKNAMFDHLPGVQSVSFVDEQSGDATTYER